MVSELYQARRFRDLLNSMQAGSVLPGKAAELNLSSEAHDFDLTIAEIREMIERQHATLVSYWFHEKLAIHLGRCAGPAGVLETDAALDAASLEKMVKAVLPGGNSGRRRGNVLTRGGGSVAVGTAVRKPWSDLYRVLSRADCCSHSPGIRKPVDDRSAGTVVQGFVSRFAGCGRSLPDRALCDQHGTFGWDAAVDREK